TENIGERVSLRGLVEFSNNCSCDCYYCGIRKSNFKVRRYTLTKEEIIDTSIYCANAGYGSIVLQSGEMQSKKFIDYVEEILIEIKNSTRSDLLPEGLGITLCVGEQSAETYRRFFKAGAHRYLLRIETSNEGLFGKLHPPGQSYRRRLECLDLLKDIGYQVGTGVMIGLPGQTLANLAEDILFFMERDIDMIGMGPFIAHHDTPFAGFALDNSERKNNIYQLALKMIAVTRIVLKDVNIASTTALQAMNPIGREEGLNFGANVVMPQITPSAYRKDYLLYEGKPCVVENNDECLSCIKRRIESTGRKIKCNEWGDSLHFNNRLKNKVL
ncbi:MAG: biotin synthase, partial [Bacteroidota bacterium]|nr:biotin synthase [Bacteroidota bacterium]